MDGTDVAKMISSSGKLLADYALTITAHVCDALGYAHANGVIHRDIKPANILINKQGQVKVTDFGLARQSDASMTAGLTRTGTTMGTPDFIAPEALTLGVDVDGRADLYAVGVMLYQMLTGEIPRGLFLMPSVKTKGETDPRFDRIITRAMQSEREERYQQASEIRKDLDAIQSSPRVKADASKIVAALPQAAVENVPEQRSGVGEKQKAEPSEARQTAAGCPQGVAKRSQSGKQSRVTETGGSKSKAGLYFGIAAAIALIGATAFRGGFLQDSDRDRSDNATVGSLATSATTAPLASSTTSDGWTDGLAEWLAVPGNAAKGTLKQEGAAWRFVGPEAVFLGVNPSGKILANVAVRLTFWHGGRNTVGIKLRIGKTGHNYNAVIRQDGATEIKLWKDERDTTLSKSNPIPRFDAGTRHVMEFRAQGNVLTLLVDGETRGSLEDDTLATGSFAVVFGVFEKIEYRELGRTAGEAGPAMRSDPAGSSTPNAGSLATSATSEGWTDGLAEWLTVAGNAAKGTLKQEGTAWRYLGPEGIGFGANGKSFANVTVRLTFRHGLGSIRLRTQKGPGNFYLASLSSSGPAEISVSKNKVLTSLAAFKARADFDKTASHTMEFRAEGDVLTCARQITQALPAHRTRRGL